MQPSGPRRSVLVLAAGSQLTALTAESAESVGGEATTVTVPAADAAVEQMHESLRDLPMPVGIGIAVLGLVYLLFGWRLSVFLVMLATALVLAGLGFYLAVDLAGLDMLVGGIAAVPLGVLGFLLGRYVHRLGGAINGAVVLGLICLVPGLVVGHLGVMAGGGLVGGVIGAILGWRWARHVDAVASSIAGAQFMGAGAAIVLAGYLGEGIAIGIGLAVLVVALVLGIGFQFRDIKHATTRVQKVSRGSTTRHGR